MNEAGVTPPFDEEAERAVLGAVMLSDKWLPAVFKTGVRAEDFYRPRFRKIWEAVTTLHDRGEPVDTLTVGARLDADGLLTDDHGLSKDLLTTLVTQIPDLGNTTAYAEIVVKLAKLRRFMDVGREMVVAAGSHDWDQLHVLEGRLMQSDHSGRVTVEKEELAERLVEWLQTEDETFSMPWESLNALMDGGVRRGGTTLVGAHSSHGKTVVLDQILRHQAGEGAKCHLWINEHTIKARALRYASAATGIPHSRIRNRELDELDWKQIMEAAQRFHDKGYGITEAAGWTAAELARDIRNRRLDVAVVDIFHRISTPTGSTQEWTEASRLLSDVTKEGLGDCHLFMAVHLNEGRVTDIERKPPTLGDIRNTGMLKNDADFVMFVHREQDKTDGSPLRKGRIWLAKARDSELGGFPVEFSPRKVQFIESDSKKSAPKQAELEAKNAKEIPF